MRYQNNENFNPVYLNQDSYGTISYMSNLNEFLLTIDEYVRAESIPKFLWIP